MDLCTGGSLYEKMEELGEEGEEGESSRQYFNEDRVKDIMKCVVNMLVNCHSRGIIYR